MMGAGTSMEGFTLENLMEQTNRILREATEIIAKCLENQAKELENFEGRAVAQVEQAFASIQEKLTDLSKQNERAKLCITEKSAKFEEIRATMKANLIECYNKHNRSIEAIKNERTQIYNEASQFKNDAQKMIENCMKSEERLDCLRVAIEELTKRGQLLWKKFDAVVKKETEARIKCTRLMIECDQKAIENAQKKAAKVIEEINKCCRST